MKIDGIMKHYYKRHWEETTGEELTVSWGPSTYYFETDTQLSIIRQVQFFENGHVLKYDLNFTHDDFGMLSDQPLDKEEFDEYTIDKEEFLNIWKFNRRTI